MYSDVKPTYLTLQIGAWNGRGVTARSGGVEVGLSGVGGCYVATSKVVTVYSLIKFDQINYMWTLDRTAHSSE